MEIRGRKRILERLLQHYCELMNAVVHVACTLVMFYSSHRTIALLCIYALLPTNEFSAILTVNVICGLTEPAKNYLSYLCIVAPSDDMKIMSKSKRKRRKQKKQTKSD